MELRGFDSYEISLGDEMRGERASLGKSLEQVEKDLRIKSRLIVAIETCDLEGFPNQSVIAGYVRSYARYLGMDAEDCYRRFCMESGYASPSALHHSSARLASRKGGIANGVISSVGAEISQSRFAAPPVANRFRARISLGALTSSAALLALIVGLGYGGYALLQDIQRVGIAPLPEAPTVVADAPQIEFPQVDMRALNKPQADDYRGGGALASVVVSGELSQLEQLRRDGPISAINPETAGMFARMQEQRPERINVPDDSIMLAAAVATTAIEQPSAPVQAKGVSIVFKEEAWIRIRESDNTTLLEGLYAAGEAVHLPERLAAPRLRAGNAGGVFVLIDGVPYGPVGQPGSVARNVSLLADDLRNSLPQAADELPSAPKPLTPVSEAQQRAEIQVAQ